MKKLLIVAAVATSAGLLFATNTTAQDTKPAAADKKMADKDKKKDEKPATLKLGQAVDASIKLPDIDGNMHSMADFEGHITVVNFWATRCPIQKDWDPTLAQIQRDYAEKGVRFLMINSNEGNGELTDKGLADDQKPYQEIRKILKERDLPYTVLVDHKSMVADRFDARTTPDIFVFDKKAKLIYRGLIDNDQRGTKGDDATHHLRNTLDALLAGKDMEPTQTKPHGCSIKRPRSDGKGKGKRRGWKRKGKADGE